MSYSLSGVDLGFAIGAVPTFSMLLASAVLANVEVSSLLEAFFQNFAAGLILAAVAAELFPLMLHDASKNDSMIGITVGFIVGLALIHGLEYFMSMFEEDGGEGSSKGSEHGGDMAHHHNHSHREGSIEEQIKGHSLKSGGNQYGTLGNSGSYEHIESPPTDVGVGMELNMFEKGASKASSSSSSGEQMLPTPPLTSPPATNPSSLTRTMTGTKVDFSGLEQEALKEEEKLKEMRGAMGGEDAKTDWEEEAVIKASEAISAPGHRKHIFEHMNELCTAVYAIDDLCNSLINEKGLSPYDAEQIAEQIDQGIHNVQYLLDHCRRLLQGSEAAVYGVTDVSNNTWLTEDKRKTMSSRIHLLKRTADHLLEHMQDGAVIDVAVLKEMHAHMDDMDKQITFAHDSVEKAAARWTRKRALPVVELGDVLPISLIVPVTVDCFVDGFLIGVSCALSPKAGTILGAANSLEMAFLGMAYAVRTTKCTGSSLIARRLALYTPPFIMLLGSGLGAYIADASQAVPAAFVGFVAFGVVALLFLVCNELLIEARAAQGEEERWWISLALFAAVYLVLMLDLNI